MKPAEAMKLSSIFHPSFFLVPCYLTIVDTKNALVDYAGAFNVEHDVNAPIKNIGDDTLSSEYLPPETQAIFLGFVLFAERFINGSALLALLER